MLKIESVNKTVPNIAKRLVILTIVLLLLGWLVNTPGGLLGKADAIGYAVCHRIDIRSFHLGDRQVPLCARCTGMYLGAMLGLGLQHIFSRKRAGLPAKPTWIVLGFFVAAFGIDGINSYLHFFPDAPALYEPTNFGRLLTGTGMGLVIAFVIYPAFNQTAWLKPDMRPALSSLKSLGLVILLALGMDWLVWSQNPLLLYLFALISALGVMTLLTMVYGVFWLMLLKSDNKFSNWTQLALPIVMGFGTALLQIGLFDMIRFALTGTWDGFHLG
jgi:uncharacterized membrane protein